jgi:hypothetical protein
MTVIRKSKNATSSALFGIAIFQGLIGLGGWTLYSVNNHFTLVDWLVTFSGALYLLLGILARFKRLWAALIGSAIYAAYLAYQTSIGLQLLVEGFLLIKLPVIALLLYALFNALRDAKATPIVVSR